MITLDCESAESACLSLAQIIRSPPEALEAFLSTVDLEAVYSAAFAPVEAPDEYLEAEVRRRFSIPGVGFTTCWFHITRVPRSERFSDGLLPLGRRLDGVWGFLGSLLDEPTRRELAAFRLELESGVGSHYFEKASNPSHWGPHALLVREVAFRPSEVGNHDYLSIPEIAEDICVPFRARYGVDLLDTFRNATSPCIVKFYDSATNSKAIRTTISYLHAKARSEPLSIFCNLCFDNQGIAVPAGQILKVEFLDESPATFYDAPAVKPSDRS